MKFGQYWHGADTRQRRNYQVYPGDENWPENVNAALILLYYPMPFPVPHFSWRLIHYPPLPTIQTQSRGQKPSLPRVFPVIIRRRTPPGGLSSTLSSLSSIQTNKPQSHSWPLEIWTAQRKSSEGSCALCDDVNSPQIGRGAGRRSDSKFGQMF